MMRRTAIALGLMWTGAIHAQDAPRQPLETSSTNRIAIQPGAAIRLQNSYGYLAVEGWDEPDAEITVTKSTDRFYRPSEKSAAEKRLSRVRVDVEQPSPKEIVVKTTGARRKNLVTSVLPNGETVITLPLIPPSKQRVTVEYTVRVPRDSRLTVQQDNGYVWVNGLTNDIEVRSHTGDMIIMLPEAGTYSIDAQTRLGTVTSDFLGKGSRKLLVGNRLDYADTSPARKVRLRMGRGSITIEREIPSGPFWRN
jgi:hypothetical protein